MSDAVDDPHCPECGEPIGQTATYCMHCSADLTGRQAKSGSGGAWEADTDDAGGFGSDDSESETPAYMRDSAAADDAYDDQILHPNGLVDNTLTVVVGIVGGILAGIVATILFVAGTWSLWGLLPGVIVWLGTTGYLVRRPTVQSAIAHSCFGVGIALLACPLIAFSPFVPADGGLSGRVDLFISFLVFAGIVAVPAGTVGAIAYVFVPENDGSGG